MSHLVKEKYIHDILDRLSGLTYNVEIRAKENLLDLHGVCEDFYVGLFNLVYGWNLHNVNELQKNIPGIDLVDEKQRIIVQVTGTSTKPKIEHSLEEIPEKYSGFHFYFAPIVIDAKQQRGYEYETRNSIIFNPKVDILDILCIVDKIRGITDIERVREIATFIGRNIRNENPVPVLLESGLEQFEIDAKISFNNLSSDGKDVIKEYASYYVNVQNIYDEYACQGKTKSKAVLQRLHKIYVKLKLQESGDALFLAIEKEIMNQIEVNNVKDKLSEEQLEMCVDILMVHAFMECKIFEKPL